MRNLVVLTNFEEPLAAVRIVGTRRARTPVVASELILHDNTCEIDITTSPQDAFCSSNAWN